MVEARPVEGNRRRDGPGGGRGFSKSSFSSAPNTTRSVQEDAQLRDEAVGRVQLTNGGRVAHLAPSTEKREKRRWLEFSLAVWRRELGLVGRRRLGLLIDEHRARVWRRDAGDGDAWRFFDVHARERCDR